MVVVLVLVALVAGGADSRWEADSERGGAEHTTPEWYREGEGQTPRRRKRR